MARAEPGRLDEVHPSDPHRVAGEQVRRARQQIEAPGAGSTFHFTLRVSPH